MPPQNFALPLLHTLWINTYTHPPEAPSTFISVIKVCVKLFGWQQNACQTCFPALHQHPPSQSPLPCPNIKTALIALTLWLKRSGWLKEALGLTSSCFDAALQCRHPGLFCHTRTKCNVKAAQLVGHKKRGRKYFFLHDRFSLFTLFFFFFFNHFATSAKMLAEICFGAGQPRANNSSRGCGGGVSPHRLMSPSDSSDWSA